MRLDRRDLIRSSALLAGALAGCVGVPDSGNSGDGGVPGVGFVSADVPRVSPDADPSVVERLVEGNARFALALHEDLAGRTDDANLLTSPYSVSVAMAMSYAGARKETRAQVADALRFALEGETLHSAFTALDDRVDPPGSKATPTPTSDDGEDGGDGVPFTLETVNAVWGQEGFPWREAYLEVLAQYYGAGLHVVDFGADPSRARERINGWVSEQTRGKIPELFPENSLGRLTRLVLTNAVYFEANWEYTFPEKQTESETFTALDGSTGEVPMMELGGHSLPHLERDGLQAIEMPYAGGEFGMVVLLPPAGELRSFEQSLGAENLLDLLGSLERTKGTLRFPKFAFRSSFELPKTLESLGMPVAFTGDANFRDMYHYDEVGHDLTIDDVLHESHVAVDETGTEAAAATGVEYVFVSAPKDPFEMTVDRPFLLCIRHRPTNAVLFFGRVGDAATAQ